MDQATFEALLDRYITGELSPGERTVLAASINDPAYAAIVEKLVEDTMMGEGLPAAPVAGEQVKAAILAHLQEQMKPAETDEGEGAPVFALKRRMMPRYVAAAAVLAFLAFGAWYLLSSKQTPQGAVVLSHDVAPGQDGAVLTLANGEEIVIDNQHTGTLATQGKTAIAQQDSGQLVYQAAPAAADAVVLYNTLTTPRGRQTNVVLSDGTRVWLNAGSSIRFPTVFAGKERRVELEGEAYFEVAKNAAKPFTVAVSKKGYEVNVLGTSFNIMAYNDEPVSVTTLVDGIVKAGGVQLAPGQQAAFGAGQGEQDPVSVADVDKAIAWKNGQFLFRNDDIYTVMKLLARWYDIDVKAAAGLENRYSGRISRHVSLSHVLKMLELAGGVHFSIDGKNVQVSAEAI